MDPLQQNDGGGSQETQVNEPITGSPQEVFGEEGQQQQQGQQDGGQQQQQGDGGEGQQQGQQQQPRQYTIDEVRELIRATQGGEQGQQGLQTQERQYTQEELDKMFDVWQPQMDLVTAIREGDEKAAIQAMTDMRNGLLRQANKMTEYQLEIMRRELLGQVAPAVTFAEQQAANRDREEFFKQNEDLRNHEKLVTTVFNALRAEGVRAKSVAEAYKLLADRTRALLPNNNGNGSGDGQSSAASNNNGTRQKPAQLSRGSQAGGGGGQSAAPNVFSEIFSDGP